MELMRGRRPNGLFDDGVIRCCGTMEFMTVFTREKRWLRRYDSLPGRSFGLLVPCARDCALQSRRTACRSVDI